MFLYCRPTFLSAMLNFIDTPQKLFELMALSLFFVFSPLYFSLFFSFFAFFPPPLYLSFLAISLASSFFSNTPACLRYCCNQSKL